MVFNLKLKNKGNVHLQPKTKIKIYAFGRLYDQLKLNRASLVFPKQTTNLAVIWPQTPAFGLYKAVSFVQYDKDKTAKKQLYLVIVPWWVLLLLSVLIFLRLRQRYRQRRSLQTAWQPEPSLPVAAGDIRVSEPAPEQQNKDFEAEKSLVLTVPTKRKKQTAVKEKKASSVKKEPVAKKEKKTLAAKQKSRRTPKKTAKKEQDK